MKLYKLFLVCLLLISTAPVMGQANTYRRIRIAVAEAEMLQWQKEELLPSHYHYKNGVLEMELDPVELTAFKNRNIRYIDITGSNGMAGNNNVYREQGTTSAPVNFSYGSMGGYFTYQEAMDVLDSMRSRFPELVSAKDTLGLTYEGRPIVAIRISDHPDSSETNEDEWLMTALHHANEVMGTHVALYFGWYLLEHYNDNKEIRDLLNNSALYLVPVVNPDGLVHNATTNPTGGGTWRKNRSPRVISTVTHYGTDLNRNYGHKWAYSHPGQLGQAGSNFAGNGYYRGTAPWSEAETQAIRNLCNSHRFVAAFNYHAWDDSFNYPWNFDIDSLTNDSLKFSAIAAYCTEDNYFEKGTFDKTLGYTANGTSDDWLYGEQTTKGKIFAFTIEVGKSFWPAQGLIITYCDSLLQANIKMLRMAAKYAAIEEISSDTISTLSCHAVYNLKRYSIKDTGFTVSVIPLDANITATGTEKLYTAIPFLGSVNDSIQFSLSPSLPNGTIIRFLLKVDNGAWFTVDTISKVYINLSTLPLSCESHIVPGNSSSQAIPIIPGVMTRAAIESKEDEDWFYFQNTIGQKYIRIVLSDLPADYDIELFDAAGQRTGFSSNPYKINDTIVYNSSYVGDFRLHVYGYKKTYHPFRCYSITAELGSDPFTEITYAALKETGNKEVDLSIFPIPAGSHVSVSVKTERAGKLNWYLTDNTGRQLVSGSRKINRGASMFSVDISMLLPGFYLLNFVPEAGTKRISFKIIKE